MARPRGRLRGLEGLLERRPCDYSGLSYDRLRGAGGIQWPCTGAAPGGTERLYTDGRFPTDPEVCEDYGHDLATGAEHTPEEYRAKQPGGRAFLRAADYQPPTEAPDDDYPLQLTTGRSLYHFHTRTKIGRAPELQRAAHGDEPDVAVLCLRLAGQCAGHAEALAPFAGRYGEDRPEEPERLHSELFGGTREGGLGLLRDLHDLYLMATECEVTWALVGQAAQGARDADLLDVVRRCEDEVTIQLKWLRTRMKQAAPQALTVAD